MSRSVPKQSPLRPLDVAQRTRGPSRHTLTAPIADPRKPGKGNTGEPSNRDPIASDNQTLPPPLPKQHPPAVKQWLNPKQTPNTWPLLTIASQPLIPATGESDRRNIHQQTSPPQWHPASRNNSYSNVATANHSSDVIQGSEAQGYSFSGDMGTATLGSLYHSQSAGQDHDLLFVGHLFAEVGSLRQHGGDEQRRRQQILP